VRTLVSAEVQHEIQQFLYREAELLDAWQMEDWLTLYAENASYVIPSTSSDPDYVGALPLISDDRARLAGRVKRLMSRQAHANNPHPRTRHTLSNIRVQEDQGKFQIRANFIIYSMRNRETNIFMGEYHYSLRRTDQEEGFLIEHKRAVLDMETLEPAGGKINFVI
jgi:p-cumate 2,3-dioxygenase subunit beta